MSQNMAVNAGGEEVSYQSRGKKSIHHQLPREKDNISCVLSMAWELVTIKTQTMVANL